MPEYSEQSLKLREQVYDRAGAVRIAAADRDAEQCEQTAKVLVEALRMALTGDKTFDISLALSFIRDGLDSVGEITVLPVMATMMWQLATADQQPEIEALERTWLDG